MRGFCIELVDTLELQFLTVSKILWAADVPICPLTRRVNPWAADDLVCPIYDLTGTHHKWWATRPPFMSLLVNWI